MRVVSQNEFDTVLAQAEGLVLVDFFADWCGPCKTLSPILEGMEPDYAGRVDFIKVNSDANQALAGAFGIRSLPTVLILQPNEDGPGAEVVGYSVGVKPAQQMAKLLDKALRKSEGGGGVVGWLKGKLGGSSE